MKVKIVEENCISCGLCAQICEDVFVIEDIAKVIVAEIPEKNIDDVKDAVDSCPTGAIVYDNNI